MLEGILSWILEKVLAFLLGKATAAVTQAVDDLAEAKKRGEINEANIKAYEEAKDRADRIRSATALLNRVPKSP